MTCFSALSTTKPFLRSSQRYAVMRCGRPAGWRGATQSGRGAAQLNVRIVPVILHLPPDGPPTDADTYKAQTYAPSGCAGDRRTGRRVDCVIRRSRSRWWC